MVIGPFFGVNMAFSKLKNVVGIPNLGQNCYFSTILHLMKCCPCVQELIFRHFEQCDDCSVTDFSKEVAKGKEHKLCSF